jgi:hypothetical protein
MKLSSFSIATILLGVACGSPKPAQNAKTEPATPSAATTTASADAVAPQKTDAKKEVEKPYVPLKWADFPGPKTAPVKGDIIWAVAPVQNADWKSSLGFYRAEETRIEGNDAIVKGVRGDVFVPGALTKAQVKKDFKKGQAVIIAHSTGLISGSSFGRVSDVVKEDGKTTYKVKYVWGDSLSEETDVQPEEMLGLDDKLGFGAPAAYKDGEKWTTAVYAAPAPDKKAYVVGWAGSMSQQAGVKPMVVSKVFKKGDKVWVSTYSTLEPATITEVVENGVQYKYKNKDGEEKTVTFTAVTTPL